MHSRTLLNGILALCVVLLLASCMPATMKKASSAADIVPGKTIVVGKFELRPALKPREQNLDRLIGIGKNEVQLVTDDTDHAISSRLTSQNFKSIWHVDLGKSDYIITENKTFYALSGYVYLSESSYIELPGFKVNIRPGDQAIYIGKIRYYRDEFDSIIKVRVIDEYHKERKLFRQKFGNKITLKKRLARVKK